MWAPPADISIGCLMVSCQCEVVIGVVMLIVNLTQPESAEDRVSMKNCLD